MLMPRHTTAFCSSYNVKHHYSAVLHYGTAHAFPWDFSYFRQARVHAEDLSPSER